MNIKMHICLEGLEPAIERILEVDGATTFGQLHAIIQVAFAWENTHLHQFQLQVEEANEQMSLFGEVKKKVVLTDPRTPDFSGEFIDENEKQLCDYIQNKGDKIKYWYDFGDDWYHSIEVIDLIEAEPLLVPKCLEFHHLAPVEDSRGEWLLDGSWKEVHSTHWLTKEEEEVYRSELNEQFYELRFSIGPALEIEKVGKTLEIQLLELASTYKKNQPWSLIDSSDLLVFEDQTKGQQLYCVVMGQLGEVLGMAVYVGEAGYQSMIKVQSGQATGYEQDCLLLSFNDRNELDREDYKLIKRNGFSFRGKQAWPVFRSHKSGYFPWHLDYEEMETLIFALDQTLAVLPNMKEDGAFLQRHSDELTTSILTNGELGKKIDFPIPQKTIATLFISPFELKQIKKQSLEIDEIYELGVEVMPRAIQEEKGEQPYFPVACLILSKQDGFIIGHTICRLDNLEEIQFLLADTFLKTGYPKQLSVQSKLALKVAYPIAAELGIPLKEEKTTKVNRVIREAFQF